MGAELVGAESRASVTCSGARLEMYQLGRLRFTLSGSGPTAAYLREELLPVRAMADVERPHIAFNLVDTLPPLARYTSIPPVYVTETSYRAAHHLLTYDVHGIPPELQVLVQPEPMDRGWWYTPEWVHRLLDVNHLGPAEVRAKNFLYGVFDYLTHIAQLSLGQSYLHASSIERDGEGTALMAWAGVGKTTAVLKLVLDHGFHYLSDDLALVDDAGTLWRTPKRMQIYGHNVAGQERLERLLLAERSFVDRASWGWRHWRHGPSQVRRRVSAEELFGASAVRQRAPLSRVYCLERGDSRAFEVQPVSTAELSRRAAEMVLHEIQPFDLLSRAVHVSSHAPVLPTAAAVASRTRAVLASALREVPAWVVRIPITATADDLASYLRQLLAEPVMRRVDRVRLAAARSSASRSVHPVEVRIVPAPGAGSVVEG